MTVRQAAGLTAIAYVLVACGSAPTRPAEPQQVRQGIASDVAALSTDAPLELRFNPAPCECPLFEVRLGTTWVRAEVSVDDVDRGAAWLAFLNAMPVEHLPVAVRALGRVDRDVVRTTQGSYAVRVDLRTLVSPLPPPEPATLPDATPATPPADAAPATPAADHGIPANP
jgi:hypothetical protein